MAVRTQRRNSYTEPEFSLETHDMGDCAMVVVRGECDLAHAEELRETVEDALDRDGDGVVINLSGVEILDSESMEILVHAFRKAEERGQPLDIIVTNEIVRRPFEVSGADRTVSLVNSISQVLTDVQRGAA